MEQENTLSATAAELRRAAIGALEPVLERYCETIHCTDAGPSSKHTHSRVEMAIAAIDALADRLEASERQADAGWTGLANIYSLIEGEPCHKSAALGMATSVVVKLKQRLEAESAARVKAEQCCDGSQCDCVRLRERAEKAERDRDLLRDKWKQMEAYGFDSPKAVFDRIAELERNNAALRNAVENLVNRADTCIGLTPGLIDDLRSAPREGRLTPKSDKAPGS